MCACVHTTATHIDTAIYPQVSYMIKRHTIKLLQGQIASMETSKDA